MSTKRNDINCKQNDLIRHTADVLSEITDEDVVIMALANVMYICYNYQKCKKEGEKMRYKYILWDWNGTLLDDLSASLESVNMTLDVYGKKRIDIDEYKSYLDTPIYKFYEHLFDLEKTPMSDLSMYYRKFYDELESTIKIAGGALRVLEVCKQKEIKQYIISASHTEDIEKYMKKLNVEKWFDKMSGSDDRKAGSKVERARQLLEEERIPKDDCVLIGDSLHDLKTAEDIGVDVILYSGGHQAKKELVNTGKIVCDTFEEIEKILIQG